MLRLWTLSLLLMPLFLAGGTGCKPGRDSKAAREYRRELAAHKARFSRFTIEYPRIERKLLLLRQKSPKRVVMVIRGEMLPLLTRIIDGFDPLISKGLAYVHLLADTVKAKPALKRSLENFEKQREVVEQVRQTYVEEAAFFSRNSPQRAALQKILDARLRAGHRMQQLLGK